MVCGALLQAVMGAHSVKYCTFPRHCEYSFKPNCTWRSKTKWRTGGIGNMIPAYAESAGPAFDAGCTIQFKENRGFKFQDYFSPPARIPVANVSRWCKYRALVLSPSAEVTKRVAAVHEQLGTDALCPGRPRTTMSSADCCSIRSRILLAMHIRTMWVDNQHRSETYPCATPRAGEQQEAADQVHSLFIPPRARLRKRELAP